MTGDNPRTRRSVLGACVVLFGALFGVTAGSATTTGKQSTAAGNAMASNRQLRSGIYSGTIDRIVDGEHVVVLLEAGGETVGERVLDPDRVPDGAEGDGVAVWLFYGRVVAVWTH